MKFLAAAKAASLLFATQASAVYLIGDSITKPIVGGGVGLGYSELVALTFPGTEWIGCDGGIAALLPSPQCGVFEPALPEGTYLDLVLEAVVGHDIVTIMYGTNDLTWMGGILEEDFVSDVLLIADAVHDVGVPRVMYVGPPDRASDLPGPFMGYYQAMVLECDQRSWLECGPNFQDVIGPEHYTMPDELHPNALGTAIMADELIYAIDAIVVPEPRGWQLFLTGVLLLATLQRSLWRRSHSS